MPRKLPKRNQLQQDARTMTQAEIAKKYGVNVGSVGKRFVEDGIVPKRGHRERLPPVDDIKELRKTHTVAAIAKAFGVTEGAVYKKMRESAGGAKSSHVSGCLHHIGGACMPRCGN